MCAANRPAGGDNPDERLLLLSTTPPNRVQVQLAAALVILFLLVLALATPFSQIRLDASAPLLPAYASALLIIEVLTAVLLFSLYAVQRTPAVLALATGYLFSGLMVVPWALTFPGVFVDIGLDHGLQSTATLAALRRIGFPLFVLLYCALGEGAPAARPTRPHRTIVAVVAVTVLLVALPTSAIVAHDGALPHFMQDASRIAGAWHYVAATAALLYCAGLGWLLLRRRSILDLWLIVVLATLLIEIILMSVVSNGIRLSIGWWTGRLYGLASTSIVLVVLLFETTSLYGRLGTSLLAERRAREARLTSMEALSASIAHEVNQPLASMVTNADAGLKWLERAAPDLGEAHTSLQRIVSDGHRAGQIVASIRDMFRRGTHERAPIALNRLLADAAAQFEPEASAAGLRIALRLEEELPPVVGDTVQMSATLANLLRNGLDAMIADAERGRTITLSSARLDPDTIVLTVADEGPGVDDRMKERIFDAFFTTKADGMGMGLMFCRSIIDSHGGRLWVSDNAPRGAVFHLSLPIEPDPARGEPAW